LVFVSPPGSGLVVFLISLVLIVIAIVQILVLGGLVRIIVLIGLVRVSLSRGCARLGDLGLRRGEGRVRRVRQGARARELETGASISMHVGRHMSLRPCCVLLCAGHHRCTCVMVVHLRGLLGVPTETGHGWSEHRSRQMGRHVLVLLAGVRWARPTAPRPQGKQNQRDFEIVRHLECSD